MGILFWIFLGMISGFTTSILFIRMDKSFWEKVTTWGPNIGVLGSGIYLEVAKNEATFQKIFTYFVVQSAGWMLAFFVMLFIFTRSSKKYNVTIGDIISGRHLKIIDSESEHSEQNKNKESLDRRKQALEGEEKRILKEREDLALQKSKSVCLNLVAEEKVPLCQEHTAQCPNFARRLSETIPFIKEAVSESLSNLERSLAACHSSDDRAEVIIETTRAVLQLVSTYINKYLIKDEGCRVHFRIQGPDETYRKFVATIGSDPRDYRDELKVIPYKDSMIEKSFSTRAPAMKSLNPSCHVAGNNDARWPDYITIAFDELTINKLPLVAMGISFPHEAFSELAKYLCQVRLDWILKDILKDYFEYINVLEEDIKDTTIKRMLAA